MKSVAAMSRVHVSVALCAVALLACTSASPTDEEAAPSPSSERPPGDARDDGGGGDGADADASGVDDPSGVDAGTDSGAPPSEDGPTIPPPPPATLWVATDGSDDNDGRSSAKPLRTIRRAGALVKAGDVVYIREGVYKEYLLNDVWTKSGEPGKPITVTGAPGEKVILDGSDRSPQSSNPSAPQLIWLQNHDWYVIRDLTLRKAGGRGIDALGNHNVILNVVSHGNHGDGIYVEGDDNLIEGCTTYDNYSYLDGGDNADGLKIGSGANNIIRYVVAYENSDDGIDLWDTTGTLVEHSVAYKNGRGTTGNGQGFKLSNDGRKDAGFIARYNVAYSNRAWNFNDNGGGGGTAYHNTSFDAGEGGFVFRGRTGKPAHTLSNNLTFQDARPPLIDIQTSGGVLPVQKTNSWNLDTKDPKFQSTTPGAPGFLRLSPSSPAIDVGTDIGQPYKGAAPDLGAFETP